VRAILLLVAMTLAACAHPPQPIDGQFPPVQVTDVQRGQHAGERVRWGGVIVETLFALPGLGQLLVNATLAKDAVVVQGVMIFVALVYVALNVLTDFFYTILDPRTRVTGA